MTAVFIWGPGKWLQPFIAPVPAGCFVKGYAFMVSASSLDESRSVPRWKMEKRYNVQALSLVGEAPGITYHDDLFPESVFLQEYFSTLWMIMWQLSRSSGQRDVPVSLWFPFFPPRRHVRYSSCAAPKGCSLREPSWQLFQIVRGSPEVPWFSGCVTFCWHFSCSTGLSHLPVVISLLANESCFSALAGLRCGSERTQQCASSISIEIWGVSSFSLAWFWFFFSLWSFFPPSVL